MVSTSPSSLSRLRRLPAALIVLCGSFLQLGCPDSNGDSIDPADLAGTWATSTGVTLAFNFGSGGQQHTVRDPQGVYSQLHQGGSDLLFQGYWYVRGSSLFLEDEDGPGACLLTTDQFIIIMNDEKTIMTLSHVSEECPVHDIVLSDHAWQRRTDES